MKKALAITLALILCLSLLPMTVLADEEFVIENGVLVEYNGPGGHVVIPEGVTAIGEVPFGELSIVTSVVIPDSVTSIGYGAFMGQPLTSVTIPGSVITIGDSAFIACFDLTDVTICEGTTTIGNMAFAHCGGLTSVVIPSSVTTIGYSVFYDTGLTEITIPEGVGEIDSWLFFMCEKLTDINIAEGNKNYSSVDGVLFNKDKSVLIAFPGGKTGSYVIPDSVTTIGEGAFAWCVGITDVTVPTGVTFIEESAFGWCENLTDIYYNGSEEQWAQIEIEEDNDTLLNATIHYSDTEPETPEIPETPEAPGATEIFTDVKSGAWYEDAVTYAVTNGLMYGVDNGKFDPDGTTTRAQLMTILARYDGADTEGGSVWYEKAMTWAMEKGISDGSDPDGYLTREQLATMLWRYAGEPAATASLASFSDAAGVSDWASAALTWAVGQGIINGDDGRLKPQDTASRAEMATMLMRFCEKLEK